MTYTYAPHAAPDGSVIAAARLRGHPRVLAHGLMHRGKLTLTFKHLHRGRYSVTLLAIHKNKPATVIGRTSLIVK